MLISVLFFFFAFVAKGQDLHYTNYNYAPLYLNPANTGGFNGNIRAGASYRDQSRTFIGEAYQSTMIWADSPVTFIFNERQWIGLGINLFSDKTGDLGFGMSGAMTSLAYHFSIDHNYNSVFALGIQYGAIQRKISNAMAANFADDFNGGTASPDHQLIQDFNTTFSDLNIGLTATFKLSKYNKLQLGASAYHINKPKYLFGGGSVGATVNPRLNIYSSIEMQLSKKFQLTPAFYYSSMNNAQNFQIQLNAKSLIKKTGNTILTYGLGYRIADALQIFAGAIYKSWEFGISYDMTTSTARLYNNTVGGIELGVKKYITIHRKPKIKVLQICPRV